MRSKIWKLLTIIFAVSLVAPAFSAVESVKVGGDINIFGVWRDNYPYFKSSEGTSYKSYNFFQTTARVYVTAELTDNVQAMIRLINERYWDCTGCSSTSELKVLLDLGYIKVTDLLTPGLTLTVGRQEIQFGEGLVVGSQYNAYGTVLGNVSVSYPFSTAANDLVFQKAFDAIRADYEVATVPVVITAFGAKITENSTSPIAPRTTDTSDTNLYGLNVEYRPDLYNLDVYYVRGDALHTDQNLDTAGLRVSGSIPAVEGLSLKLEYAKQFGEDGSDNDYDGWALLFGGSYEFPVDMKPVVRVAYNLFSGDDNGTNDKECDDWQMVFPSNIASRIGPVYYAFSANNTASLTTESNLQVINLGLDIQPVEKVKLSLDGYWLKGDEDIGCTNEDDIGYEVDLGVNYQYTEDLSFGLTGGMLFTGDLFDTSGYDDDNPWQLIASMKVAF